MAFDAHDKPVTAWTKYADLTADQRARFGGYVLAKEARMAELTAMREGQDRADAALIATGGDKLAALGMLLKGRG